jgi:hypothetical protein
MGRVLSVFAGCALAFSFTFVAGAYAAPDTSAALTSKLTNAVSEVKSAGTAWTSNTTTQDRVNAKTATSTTLTTSSASTTSVSTTAAVTTTGNGAPSGLHFNLNILGVPKDKTASMTNNDGHRIFVQLNGGEDATTLNGKLASQLIKTNKIFLQPAPAGESFQVLDANATDADGARFQLPADVSASWTVWARALGKPGGKSNTTTCANTAGLDGVLGTADDEVLCSMATLKIERIKGKQSFVNVSAELLFMTVTVDPTTNAALATCLGVTTTTDMTVPLFNTCLQNYFWNYDSQGLKLLQLRFYPTSGFGT